MLLHCQCYLMLTICSPLSVEEDRKRVQLPTFQTQEMAQLIPSSPPQRAPQFQDTEFSFQIHGDGPEVDVAQSVGSDGSSGGILACCFSPPDIQISEFSGFENAGGEVQSSCQQLCLIISHY